MRSSWASAILISRASVSGRAMRPGWYARAARTLVASTRGSDGGRALEIDLEPHRDRARCASMPQRCAIAATICSPRPPSLPSFCGRTGNANPSPGSRTSTRTRASLSSSITVIRSDSSSPACRTLFATSSVTSRRTSNATCPSTRSSGCRRASVAPAWAPRRSRGSRACARGLPAPPASRRRNPRTARSPDSRGLNLEPQSGPQVSEERPVPMAARASRLGQRWGGESNEWERTSRDSGSSTNAFATS